MPQESYGPPTRPWVAIDNEEFARLRAHNIELLAACERVLAAPCPRDTNGDGDCGQHSCPWCGKEIREAVAKAKQ